MIAALPSKFTPLIALAVARIVAEPALPVVDPEAPVTDPEMGLVTVRLPSVPTEVSDDETTVELIVVPVSALAGELPELPEVLAVLLGTSLD